MRQILGGFGLLRGATYPFRAFHLFLKNPRLWQYLIIPILVNLILGILLYVAFLFPSWEFIQNLIMKISAGLEQLIINLPSWLGLLIYLIIAIGWLVKIILILALFLIIGFILVQFGTILGSPWYGKLSEELEKIKTGKVEVIEVNIFVDIWRAILFEIKKLLLMLTIGLPLLLLNLVPTLGNLISAIGGIILTATIVCLDFLDAPLERRRLPFRQKLSLVWQGFPTTAGFSLVCLGLISIPFLNLLIIPICVASGTLLFCDLMKGEMVNFVTELNIKK
jgi:CysZ protein